MAVPIAFGLVYLIWGSTYLAIRYGVETIPPFLLAGTRFFVDPKEKLFAIFMLQGPGQREHYSTALSNMVYSTFDD